MRRQNYAENHSLYHSANHPINHFMGIQTSAIKLSISQIKNHWVYNLIEAFEYRLFLELPLSPKSWVLCYFWQWKVNKSREKSGVVGKRSGVSGAKIKHPWEVPLRKKSRKIKKPTLLKSQISRVGTENLEVWWFNGAAPKRWFLQRHVSQNQVWMIQQMCHITEQ